MKPNRIIPAFLAALLLVLVLPLAAHASCAEQPPLSQSLAESSVVFTGTVMSVDAGDRIATVLIDEVWKGGPLPDQVEVRGGPGDPQSITSVDRSFVKGDKYLFVPVNDAPPFEDNACTATREYSPQLENARTLDVSEPGDGEQADPPAPAGPLGDAPASAANEGPSQATKGLIFAISLGLAMAVGYVLKRRAGEAG